MILVQSCKFVFIWFVVCVTVLTTGLLRDTILLVPRVVFLGLDLIDNIRRKIWKFNT